MQYDLILIGCGLLFGLPYTSSEMLEPIAFEVKLTALIIIDPCRPTCTIVHYTILLHQFPNALSLSNQPLHVI